ncbi:MAG: hypothetical protein ACXW18_03480 [Pyrinomonadaceae bacterium]
MKKTSIFTGALVTGMLLSGGLNAFGQQKEPSTTAPATPEVRVSVSPQGEKPPPGASTFNFVTSEFASDGRSIKGSPYSAEAVTETTQILSDGNRIVNRSTANLYRDSEGRTRREQSLKAIGGVATGAQPLQTIMISDPVAGVSYSLDPATRTARKTPMGNFTFTRSLTSPNGGTATGGASFVFSGSGAESGNVRSGGGTGAGTSNAVALPSTSPPSISWTAQSGGGAGYQVITRDGSTDNVNKEDLGTQTVEGVAATGTRITITIPAGQVGNERPIEIVDERWFSKDLQTVVMTRHADPRSGETVYRLTNINRGEPDRSLFEVPGDYQMKENTSPMRTRKPE